MGESYSTKDRRELTERVRDLQPPRKLVRRNGKFNFQPGFRDLSVKFAPERRPSDYEGYAK
jgi:hypothetical protein